MDTTIPEDTDLENPPRKRVKLDDDPTAISNSQLPDQESNKDTEISITEAEREQATKELAVGIEAFVSNDVGFQGVLKRRYHDFLVNEVMPDGKVVRLDDPALLKLPSAFLDDGGSRKKDGGVVATNGASNGKGNGIVQGDGGVEEDQTAKDADGNTKVSPELQFMYDLSGGTEANPKQPRIELTDESFKQLQKYFDMEAIKKLAVLFHTASKASPKDIVACEPVDSLPVDSKDDRRMVHQLIRTIFLGRIVSAHQEGDIIRCTAVVVAANTPSHGGKSKHKQKNTAHRRLGFRELGGEYMHFTLYKENRDSGDILGYIASMLGMKGQRAFDTAGNKDRRAVTVQRVSGHKIKADRFLSINNALKQAHVGDCCYSENKLQLGDLAGNEFVITLRDCTIRMPDSESTIQNDEDIRRYVRKGMQNLRDNGFINYYGLQRFGSFASRTDLVGQHMIRQDYQAAVEMILEFSPEALQAAQSDSNNDTIASDDKRRAQAIHWFLTKTGSTDDILTTLPRRFTAEYAIISFLLKSKDQTGPYYRGALEAIPRNMRSLYPHAYQSLIWNLAASHRWTLSPGKLLPGDLVLTATNHQQTQQPNPSDPDPIYAPISTTQSPETAYVLTEEDIASGKYTIFDIVLPQPGYDVLYPAFMLPFYRSAMSQHGGMDPENMRRNWREVSLPGFYRKLLGRPNDGWACELARYHEPDAKIALTDWDRLELKREREKQDDALEQEGRESVGGNESGIVLARDIPHGERLAIVLRFQLPASTYATMALRELMKNGPVEYRPEFSGGRSIGKG